MILADGYFPSQTVERKTMSSNLVDDLIKVRTPALLSAMSDYKDAARGLGSQQQVLLLAEAERRIRQSIAILLRVDQLDQY